MLNDALQSMFYIGLIYVICMCILIPMMIYLLNHKKDPLNTRWLWPLGFIIIFTILVAAFEGGIAGQL